MEDRLIIGYTSGNYIDSACLTVLKEKVIINEGVGPNIVKRDVINTVYGYLAKNLYRILTEPNFLKDSIVVYEGARIMPSKENSIYSSMDDRMAFLDKELRLKAGVELEGEE